MLSLDFTMVFKKVDRAFLTAKLSTFGILGNAMGGLEDYLGGRHFCIRVSCASSEIVCSHRSATGLYPPATAICLAYHRPRKRRRPPAASVRRPLESMQKHDLTGGLAHSSK
ncbi:hypothetical protein AHF37_08358 [Paragonimus kellicotti]|nr:hypothetical protein AHF37_08358 [Paragonimus kellicotti]